MYKGMNKSKLRKIHPLPLGEGGVWAQDVNRLATLTLRGSPLAVVPSLSLWERDLVIRCARLFAGQPLIASYPGGKVPTGCGRISVVPRGDIAERWKN